MSGYQPTPDDLDYPAKLSAGPAAPADSQGPPVDSSAASDVSNAPDQASTAKATAPEANGAASPPAGESVAAAVPDTAPSAAEEEAAAHNTDAAADSTAADHWYPPVYSTLLCLSKLYRAVDQRIFAGLAQEAVSACTTSVQQASRQVSRRCRAHGRSAHHIQQETQHVTRSGALH